MKQVVLAGLVAGALAVGQSPAASAQATSGQAATGQTRRPGQTGARPPGHDQHRRRGPKPAGPRPLPARRRSARCASPAPSRRTASRLAAGSYTVRLTEEEARPEAKGQDPSLERWVEFLQGSQVKGREVVTIVPESDIAQVSEGKRVPKGSSRVEMLKGNDYVRVWINRGGQQLPDPPAAGLISPATGGSARNAQCRMHNVKLDGRVRVPASSICILHSSFFIVHFIDVTPPPSHRTARGAGACRAGW